MPFNFDIPTYGQMVLPLQYRLIKWKIFVQSLLYVLTWRWNIFQGYRDGDVQLDYVGATTYDLGDKVKYNFKTWESLQDANTGNIPDTSPLFWVLRNDNFIGATERAHYSGNYLKLTYQLNKQFATTFRPLPYPPPYDFGTGSGTFSDIYITNAPILYVPFVAGLTSDTSSMVAPSTTVWWVPDTPTYGTSSSYGFIIHVPAAVWTALGSTAAIRNSIINSFVALYAPCGLSWTIVTY